MFMIMLLQKTSIFMFKNNETKEQQRWDFLTKCHFNLRQPKGDNPSMVYLVFKYGKKQYKVSCGYKVRPCYWSKKDERALISPSMCQMEVENNVLINNKILDMTATFSSFIAYLCTNGNVDEAISKYFMENKKKVKKHETLQAVLLTALRNSNMKDASFVQYKQTITEFCSYCKKTHKIEFVEEVDIDVIKGFLDYLFSQKTKHKYTGEMVAPQNNTVKISMQRMLTVYGYCDFNCDAWKKVIKTIKTFKQDENQIYLNQTELDAILNYRSTNEKMLQIRDLFIFQQCSAQRWSDIEPLLGKKLEVTDRMITLHQKKTKAKVTIPLDDIAINVLEKYNYVLPKIGYRTVENSIKDICKECGIDELIEGFELRANKEYRFSVPKYKMIGTHTCRRSKISNLLQEGFDGELIRKISGHTSPAFSKYNRLSSEDVATKILSKTAGNGSGNASNVSGDKLSVESKINEYKRVLAMLGVNALEWIELNNEEELFRLIVNAENQIVLSCGCDYKVLKDIFNNNDLSIGEKFTIINNMLN